jgi:PAS domain S-box-containing protein
MLSPKLIDSALRSAPDALVVADASGCIVFVNHQAVGLFGYAREEMLRRPVELLLPERSYDRHVGHRQAFGSTPRVRPMGAGLELCARRKDGSEFPVEISLSPISDGDAMLVVAAIRDVTDRRRIEAELRATREEADRANQAKSRFLATASHDLRQPLQALSLLNGTLRRMRADPALTEVIGQQEHAISAMSRLVNALLDISKLESGAIKPEITDFTVGAIFEDLRREFTGLAAAKGLELRVEPCQDAVHSDPSLIEQILRNIVSNAIKYTQRGRVLLRCLHEPALIRLEVLDTGIGIAPEQLPYIYDEFFQVGVAPNDARDGYGLGLSIVNRLVKLLDLKLDVHSEPGRGSSFRLGVPASTGAVASGCTAVVVEATNVPRPLARRVLLVEDDPGVRNATRLLLEAEGFPVVPAASYVEAIEKVRDAAAAIDLLITDYHLGTETGLDVIASLRERFGAQLPAILLSGDTSPAIRGLTPDERLRVTSKPIEADRLLALIGELFLGLGLG